MRKAERHTLNILITLVTTALFCYSLDIYAANNASYENRLLTALDHFLKQNHNASESDLIELTHDYPTSRTGYLLRADILATRAGLTPVLAETMEHLGKDRVSEIRKQLRARWHYLQNIRFSRRELLPTSLLKLEDKQRWAIYMDIPAKRLILFKNEAGQLHEVKSFYASIGIAGHNKRREGDRKTPVGVYQITGFIPGRKLHERYGPGALTLNYPNEIDQLYERTGSGIWIHGTEPGFVNRSPRASDGCLSLANEDFLAISHIVKDAPFVPVVIDNAPEWVNVNEHNHRQKILWQTIEEWYKEEVVLGFPALGRFHEKGSPDNPSSSVSFSSQGEKIGLFKNFLNLRDTQFFKYPGMNDLYIADISLVSNQDRSLEIRQYWHRNDFDQWSILTQVKR